MHDEEFEGGHTTEQLVPVDPESHPDVHTDTEELELPVVVSVNQSMDNIDVLNSVAVEAAVESVTRSSLNEGQC